MFRQRNTAQKDGADTLNAIIKATSWSAAVSGRPRRSKPKSNPSMLMNVAAMLAIAAAGSDRKSGSSTMLFRVKGIRPDMLPTSISIGRPEINHPAG